MAKTKMLTQKQEGFTLDLYKELSETEAYQNHYQTENMSIEAIYVEACRLAANPKVALRLAELRNQETKRAIATVTEREERLTTFIREDNRTDRGNLSRSGNIQATAELNRMTKVYDDRPSDNPLVQTFIFVLPDGTRVLPSQLKPAELKEGEE